MDRRNYSNIGEEIKDIVQNAVNSRDFQQLNNDIRGTVQGALDEVKDALGGYRRGGRGWNNTYNNRGQWNTPNGSNGKNYEPGAEPNRGTDAGANHDSYSGSNAGAYNGSFNGAYNGPFSDVFNRAGAGSNGRQNYRSDRRQRYAQEQNRWQKNNQFNTGKQDFTESSGKKRTDMVPYAEVGKVPAILYTVFGSIGIGTFGIGAGVLALVGYLTGSIGVLGTIALCLLPLFAGSIMMSARGSVLRGRLNRFRRYLGILGGKSYYSIKELAAGVGKSKNYVLKDVRKMIALGMFPEGRIDEQETCLILSRESYTQYLEMMESIRARGAEANTKKEADNIRKEGVPPQNINPSADNPELAKALTDGRACIRQMREANDAIPGEEISKKLDRLEAVTGKIFDYVELHPMQLTEIQKFMEYYLPTTLKLINTYKEFDMQPVQGENITSTKNEIEATLDTINLAFEKLLDSLFEDAAMDTSTDISVLQTMLAQEGLTPEEFKANKKMGGKINE